MSMGLDQAILIGPKGQAPDGVIMEFRKHDRLHGYMERLSYQKGIVDPFDQIEVDWDAIEKRVEAEIREQFKLDRIISHPTEEQVNKLGANARNEEHIRYTPSFSLEAYSKGRLHNELVPLTEEDFNLLVKHLHDFTEASSDEERDKILPPCKGFFFGESNEHEWLKTFLLLKLVFDHFGFEEFDFYYHSNW